MKLKEKIQELKEADAFVKSEYDTDQEYKDDKIAKIALISIAIIIVIVGGVSLVAIRKPISKIINTYSNLDDPEKYDPNSPDSNNGNGNSNDSNNPYISGNGVTTYKKYKIGDTVTLIDDSKWYVIQNSDVDDSNVILISPNNINNGTLNYDNINEYLETTYVNEIAKRLKTSPDELIVRLISLYDLSILSGIDEEKLDVNSVISNGKTPAFIYESINLTNYFDDDDYPVLICPTNGKAVLCSGNPPLNPWPIKPVLDLSKEYVK